MKPDRPPVLSEVQADKLKHFVCSSRVGQFITYLELDMVQSSHWNVGKKVIRNTLERRGYKRCVSQSKPPISKENKMRLLLFAWCHLSWTIKQWNNVLWTDQSWITGGQHTCLWVTRKVSSLIDSLGLPRTKSRLARSLTRWAYLLSLFEEIVDVLGIFPLEPKQ